MRTTLSIDDDVLFAAKERAAQEKRTVGEVISDLARQALTASPIAAADGEEPDEFFGFRPLPRREGVVVTNELINRLREDGPY